MRKLMDHLKKRFIAGLFIVIPLGITIFILKFLFGVADGILGPYIADLFNAITRRDAYIPGTGMLTGLLVVYLTGLLATNFVGRHLGKWWNRLISMIPLVNTIYSSSRQLIQVFREGKNSYRRAVFVEWPRKGVRVVGFVTAEVERDGERLVVVFIPTTPNPTSGFALFFRRDEVVECGMTVEEAVKFVMSGGVVVS
jgi:uncharacterized membrane protein